MRFNIKYGLILAATLLFTVPAKAQFFDPVISSAAPSGAAGGTLSGTYPNPDLATAQPDMHTWALVQTFTKAPVFTDASGSRTALGLGALSTVTPGTGVATALAVNVGSAGAFVVLNGALGTPSSGTATNLSGTAASLTAGNVTGLSVTAGKTLTVSNSITLTATDGSTLAIGTGGTLATAAYKATGTNGNTVPLLDGANTWSASQTLSAALVYGGVTLANSVTGTGSMALSISPTFTGTVNAAAVTASDLLTANTLRLTGVTDKQAPINGFSITIAAGARFLMLTPAGALATGTITMPAVGNDADVVYVVTTQTITSLTVSANAGQAILGAPSTILANGSFGFVYNGSNNTWYRLQ